VLRWTSFWTLLARDPDYASFDYADRLAALERVDGRPALEHLHPPFQGGGFDGALDLGPLAGRLAERRPELGAGTGAALDAALDWLARHQEEDGSWSPGGFWMRCASEPRCEGPGSYGLDVGVSALALLAFLGNGDTTVAGPHQRQVQRGIVWLLGEQDADSGRFGRSSGPSQVYEHAIATLAIGEAAAFSGHRVLRDAARRGIAVIQAARNPQAAWRYGFAPDGSDDTSVTAWMVQALDAGRRVGLEVDEQCFQGALSWLDEATQPENGRCGYDATGTLSARVSGSNDQYPPENGEALTGAALFLRSLIGQRAESTPLLEQHAELLLQKLPEWNPEGLTCDMYYWYYGSMGLRQLGGSSFAAWADALAPAALGGQRQDGDAAGSWDPVGPWGFSGGRVYATAMMALCLEAPYRFAPPAEAQGSTKKR